MPKPGEVKVSTVTLVLQYDRTTRQFSMSTPNPDDMHDRMTLYGMLNFADEVLKRGAVVDFMRANGMISDGRIKLAKPSDLPGGH